MKTMKWLLKRELWEHKGSLLYTPLVLGGLLAALMLVSILFGRFNGNFNELHFDRETITNVTIEGKVRTHIAQTLADIYLLAGTPVLMVLGLLVFFYCLGALHDERRDRSLLFWKSLPVSDLSTVLSKLLTALVVAPLIAVGVTLALGLLALAAACTLLLTHGTNLFGELLLTPAFYLTPLRLLALLPVYILWALPTVGWLLMVSSMARSKVFLWAVGTPLITTLLLAWAERVLNFGFSAVWFSTNITSRMLLGVVPGAWLPISGERLLRPPEGSHGNVAEIFFNASWNSLGAPGVWLGAAAGIAMIALAVWMRRRREEA